MIPQWWLQEALLLAYPHSQSDWKEYLDEVREFYDEFIQIVAKYQPIWLIAPLELKKTFPNTQLFYLPTNDTWVRDYAPISVFNKGGIKLLDFTFNGWGLKFPANLDNTINRKLFKTKKLGFVLEGGSVDSNGEGVILTTSSCLLEENRNPHLSKTQIQNYLKKVLKVRRVIWLENTFLEGDDTNGHIDLFVRFISPKRLVYISCEDKQDPRYEMLKRLEEEIQKLNFEAIPLPLPSRKFYQGRELVATYANFVILNKAVIVPTYQDSNDGVVLNLFRKLFPNREVIGLDSTILIRQGGAIHCSCANIFKV